MFFFLGIRYVERDCPRVNHYLVVQNSKRLQFGVNGSDKHLEKSFNHLSKVTNSIVNRVCGSKDLSMNNIYSY